MTEAVLRFSGVRTPEAPAALHPFVSVIVPVRNEEKFLSRVLEQLLTQEYPRDAFEILVADGRSTDATREIVLAAAGEYPNVRLLDNPLRWSSSGRNAAVRAARGDVLVLIDGHCELDGPHYLSEIVNAFQRSGADCLGRPQPLDTQGATPLQQAIALGRASRLGHNPSSYIYSSLEGFVKPQSVAVAYRRSVFSRVGFFDESFDACEDVEFNHRVDRAGLRCFFTPRVGVRYHPRATLRGLFRQMARYGRGRVRMLRKHTETFSIGCFIPAAFTLGVLTGPLAALAAPVLGQLYLGVLALYSLIITLVSLQLTIKARNIRLMPWLPLVFLSIHLGAGLGILLEAIVGARRSRVAQLAPGDVPQMVKREMRRAA